jgi:hypothetical protein
MNTENIKAELERLRRIQPHEVDTIIQRAIEHRIKDLERMLEEKKGK